MTKKFEFVHVEEKLGLVLKRKEIKEIKQK
jgi:hypothetical protein